MLDRVALWKMPLEMYPYLILKIQPTFGSIGIGDGLRTDKILFINPAHSLTLVSLQCIWIFFRYIAKVTHYNVSQNSNSNTQT